MNCINEMVKRAFTWLNAIQKSKYQHYVTRRSYRSGYLLCITSVSRTHHDFVGIMACPRSFHLYRSGLRRLERIYP